MPAHEPAVVFDGLEKVVSRALNSAVLARKRLRMLYYRLYKRMKRNFGFVSGVSPSLDYITFVVLIPIAVGFVIAKLVQEHVSSSEGLGYVILMLSMGSAAVYIHLCEKNDKDP
jgi:uncharacterized membrane protein (DUF485 family)